MCRATPTKAAAFPFFYIEPKKPGNKEVIQPYVKNGFPVEEMAPIGTSGCIPDLLRHCLSLGGLRRAPGFSYYWGAAAHVCMPSRLVL